MSDLTLSSFDLGGDRPSVDFPRRYNAAHDFIDKHLAQGRAGKVAVIDDGGQYTYADLAERVNRAGNALKTLGVKAEQRVMMCMLDSIDFMALFWGAIKIGAVPVPVNTLLTTEDYDFMLADSRAGVLALSSELWQRFEDIVDDKPALERILLSGAEAENIARGTALSGLLEAAEAELATAETTKDDACFWLYSSGSTGRPKGVVHLQSDMANTAALYGIAVLAISEDDIVFSAAKLFFAYGLGNAMSFPFYVGATAVLMAERPTPQSVMQRLKDHEPTVFYGVPTLYGGILADDSITRANSSPKLRICVSAGEALPEDIAKRWVERFGVDILDGIGSTELLHIFLSNRPDDIRYGSTGKAVPGYALRIVDEDDRPVAVGELGELLVDGPSAGAHYWNNREKSLATFQGPWTRTGDKYVQDADGYFVYAGRSDDMLKVSGIWVSPFEVESALVAHDDVVEAAVVGQADADRLIKPKAYIIARDGAATGDQMADELKQFVKDRLAPYKYPRWIEFVDALPKTATGKIQRFKLRN